MQFDYEKNLWGKEEATLSLFSPTYFRLKKALQVLKKTPIGENILDFGCGAGRFIRALRNRRPDLRAFGCDISVSAISLASRANDNVNYTVNQVDEKLPYQNDFFANIFIFDVLEHVVDVEGVLKEWIRVLKKDGILFLQVPCEKDWLSLWFWLDKVGLKKEITKKFAGHVNFFSRKELKDTLQRVGFKIEKRYYCDHFLGQKAGILAFYLTAAQAKKKNLPVYNNETCMSELKESRGMGWSFLGKFANFLINCEALLLQKIPSANVFYILKKK
ncbi:MAG TPA: methyltransferase domain-containing protein [Candidatus Magasanikbacteria bacterium]|nr:methyltransferase domain-containing protein [Candidatus Magasanikbacteria bacterium]